MTAIRPKLVILTNTWLNKNIPNQAVNIPNYELFRRDREGRRGDSVEIYVRSEVGGSRIHALLHEELSRESCLEDLWLNMTIARQNILLGAIYRSPSQNPANDAELLQKMGNASAVSDATIIAGEFNMPSINLPITQ